MSDRVFGPHVTGSNFLGMHIGATIEVFRDSSGGKKVPQSLSVVLTPPLGSSATIGKVENGQTATVKVSPGIDVSAVINDARTEHGPPETFAFKVTLRAKGSTHIPPLPIPVPIDVQIDAFDVHVPTDNAVHAKIVGAHSAPH
jgi:hypothetical protein